MKRMINKRGKQDPKHSVYPGLLKCEWNVSKNAINRELKLLI